VIDPLVPHPGEKRPAPGGLPIRLGALALHRHPLAKPGEIRLAPVRFLFERFGERVRFAAGPRAAEKLLLAEIAREVDAARKSPRLLARPLRVIVPSRSLREHVAAKLAHEHEALRSALDALDEGYGPVAESVRDLLDAGLDETSAGAAQDALAAGDDAATARARAIVALALRVREELAALGLAAPAALFERACAALARVPSAAYARALWIHGYADVTGVQLDLIEQLVAHAPDP